jgi:hypothetical protein
VFIGFRAVAGVKSALWKRRADNCAARNALWRAKKSLKKFL